MLIFYLTTYGGILILPYGIPNDHSYRVCGNLWGFHMFIFYLTTYGGTLILPYGIPNDHACSAVHLLVGISCVYFFSAPLPG